MLVSVAICTWNRADLLDQTLTHLRNLQVPAGVEWELLVVDNNSTDRTADVLKRHEAEGRLPLRRLFEPKPGHSNARNCAVDHARGELILWTDDDVLVAENWLAEYARVAQEHPEAEFFGGPIDPWFGAEMPRGMRAHLDLLGPAFAIRDFGPEVRPLALEEFPFGANMAFRLPAQRANRYQPHLGRVGTGLVGCDETIVFENLKKAGRPGIWVGTARVKHYIPPARLTWSYVWAFHVGVGQTIVRRTGVPTCPLLFGRPRWMLREYGRLRLLTFARRLLARSWVPTYIEAAKIAGMLAEYQARRGAAGPVPTGYLVPPA